MQRHLGTSAGLLLMVSFILAAAMLAAADLAALRQLDLARSAASGEWVQLQSPGGGDDSA